MYRFIQFGEISWSHADQINFTAKMDFTVGYIILHGTIDLLFLDEGMKVELFNIVFRYALIA